jgi:hypothetical protein
MLDRAVELYRRCIEMGLGSDHDVAVMVDVIRSLPRATETFSKSEGGGKA